MTNYDPENGFWYSSENCIFGEGLSSEDVFALANSRITRPTFSSRPISREEVLINKILKAIESEDTLTVASKNILIIIEEGHVILRGEVFEEHEKLIIGRRASKFGRVINELKVNEELE